MTRLALLPDEPDLPPTELSPRELAGQQACDALDFMTQIRESKGLRFPWYDLDRMVAALLPGWLVAVGGRAKSGKTSMLLELLTDWTSRSKRVVYVGTETSTAMLRYQWGAMRCGVPIDEAINPDCPRETYDRVMSDVMGAQREPALANQAIFADSPRATVSNLAEWVEYAYGYHADAVIFDHLSQLEVGAGERWQHLGDAIREIKRLAVDANLTIVVGAQLTQGQGGSFRGEHEVPGNGSWAGSSEVQRVVDVGIQLWRPYKPGITNAQKVEAGDDMTKIRDLVQENVMGVRLAAHRWGKEPNQFCRLNVREGRLTDWRGL